MTTANLTIENVLFKRANSTVASAYTGALGEIIVDTTLKTLRVQDGATAGGTRLAKYSDLESVAAGNLDLSGYATTAEITAANANAAAQAVSINSITANIGAYQTYANVIFSTVANAVVQADLLDALSSNAATQSQAIDSISANVGAYQTYANSSIASLQANAALQADLLDTLTSNAATQGGALNDLVTNAATQADTLSTLLSNAVAQQTTLSDLVANAAIQAQEIAAVTGTYSNANVQSYLTAFDGNILPAANVTYSLGSEQYQWRDLWVSNNTVYIGGTAVGVTDGNLVVNGNLIPSFDQVQSFVNEVTYDQDLNTTDNVSFGNLALNGGQLTVATDVDFSLNLNNSTFGPANMVINSQGYMTLTGGITTRFYAVDKEDENIGGVGWSGNRVDITGIYGFTVTTGIEGTGGTWQFNDDGTNTFPGGLLFDVFGQIYNTGGTMVVGSSDYDVQILANVDSGNPQTWAFGVDGNLTVPDDSYIVSSANVYVQVDTNTWNFRSDDNSLSTQNGSFNTGTTNLSDGVLSSAPGSSLTVESGDDLVLAGTANVQIQTDASGSYPTWTFGVDGNTAFPGNITVQGFIGTSTENLRVESEQGKISLNNSQTALSLYNDAGGTYTSASWSGNNIDFTGVEDIYLETLLERFDSHFAGSGSPWAAGYSNITVRINGNQTLTVTGASFLGGTNWRVEVAETPASDPTAITTAEFFYDFVSTLELDRNNNSYAIALDDSNFRINTRRDIRLESGDDIYIDGRSNMRLRNYSRTSGITIETDFNNEAYEWQFGENGTLTTPGDITVVGHITGTSSASTLVLAAEPSSNTYIQLNDTVDSTINTVANLEIRTNVANTARTWRFDTTGNLTLPASGAINYSNGVSILDGIGGGVTGNISVDASAIQFVASSSGDGNGYSTIRMIPDTYLEGTDQYLIIDPTAPGHIHIRAGGTQDNSSADLILGGENSHVLVAAGSSPPVYIRANSASWMFDTDSSLIMPTGGNLYFDSSAMSVIDGITSIAFADATVQTTAWTGLVNFGNTIAIGYNTGTVAQGSGAVAVGSTAGNVSQGIGAVAVGESAGRLSQGAEGIAIGKTAGEQSQGAYSIAIGSATAYYQQGTGAVAIGTSAGALQQGTNAVAIGTGAGNALQGNNSIILNATGSMLDQTTDNTFTVKPIRNASGSNVLYYDATTGEITYDTGGGTYGNTEVGAYLLTGINSNLGTLVATNFSTANARITGGSITGITGAASTLVATNFSSGNIRVSGGYISALTNAYVTTSAITNFSTANARITGGSVTGITGAATTFVTTDFSSSNVAITGGYLDALANVTTTGNVIAANLIGYGSNTTITAGEYISTFDTTGMVTLPSVTAAGNLTVAGNVTQQSAYYETYANVANVDGNLTCNFVDGATFYATLTANVTVNFVNVALTTGTIIGATVIVDQDATPYQISNVQINGGGVQTVRWAGGTGQNPGTGSNTDVMSFSLINLGNDAWRVLGQISNYG